MTKLLKRWNLIGRCARALHLAHGRMFDWDLAPPSMKESTQISVMAVLTECGHFKLVAALEAAHAELLMHTARLCGEDISTRVNFPPGSLAIAEATAAWNRHNQTLKQIADALYTAEVGHE